MLKQEISPWSIYDDFTTDTKPQSPSKSEKNKHIQKKVKQSDDSYLKQSIAYKNNQINEVNQLMNKLFFLKLIRSQLFSQKNDYNRGQDYVALPKIYQRSVSHSHNYSTIEKNNKNYYSKQNMKLYKSYAKQQLQNLVSNNLQIETVGKEHNSHHKRPHNKRNQLKQGNNFGYKLPNFSEIKKPKIIVLPNNDEKNSSEDYSFFDLYYAPQKNPQFPPKLRHKQSVFLGSLKQSEISIDSQCKNGNVRFNFYGDRIKGKNN